MEWTDEFNKIIYINENFNYEKSSLKFLNPFIAIQMIIIHFQVSIVGISLKYAIDKIS